MRHEEAHVLGYPSRLPESEMCRDVSHDSAPRCWMFSATERLVMDQVLATVALPAVGPIWAPILSSGTSRCRADKCQYGTEIPGADSSIGRRLFR
jgi:hypothetical protein